MNKRIPRPRDPQDWIDFVVGIGTRNVRRLSKLLAISLAVALTGIVLALIGSPSNTQAATVMRGDRVLVPRATTIDDDLYIVATRAVIDGTINGDLIVASVFANVVGPVNGGLTVMSGRAEVRGPVTGDVRAVGASVAVYGKVSGDLVIVGGSITLVEGAVVAGDIVLLGGKLSIIKDATVGGNVRGVALDVDVEGWVIGDVRLTVRRLFVAPDALIDGAVSYVSAAEAAVAPGATVRGAVERRNPAEFLPLGSVLLWQHAALLRLLAMLTAGAILIICFPRHFVATANAARGAPVEAMCVGFGLLICLPVALLLAAVTVVGLPLAILGAVGGASAIYLSQAVAGLALGRLMLGLPLDDSRRGINTAAMSGGVVAITGIRLIPLEGISLLVPLVIAIFGLGAIVVGVGRREAGPEHLSTEQPSRQRLLGALRPGKETKVAEDGTESDRRRSSAANSLASIAGGYLIGFFLFVAASAVFVLGAIWLIGVVLALGTSISVTMAIPSILIVPLIALATAVLIGIWLLAVFLYRH